MTYNIRSYVGSIATDTPIETTCQTIRNILGLSLDWAFKEYSMGDAIRKLVTRMEDSGTMVCINNMVGNNTFRKLRRISPTFMIHLSNAAHANKILYLDAYRLAGLKGDTFHNVVGDNRQIAR